MKPEVPAAREKEKGEDPITELVETDMALTEEENLDLILLKANSPIDLNELKGQTGLSSKKWDKAIKGLTKKKLARVERTYAGFFVTLLIIRLEFLLVNRLWQILPMCEKNNQILWL